MRQKLLLIRMDKIGDLVLTLSADQSSVLSEYETHWVIANGLDFVAKNANPPRSYVSFETKFSFKIFLQFYRHLRSLRPEVAVVFYAPTWVAWALMLARVPNRIGRRSRPSSFFTFNLCIRQSRSLSVKHESQYNWELLHQGLAKAGRLRLTPADSPSALRLKAPEVCDLSALNLRKNKYIVVHPGMAGSAFNWPSDYYIDLITYLKSKGETIVITGTEQDDIFLRPLRAALGDKVIWLDGKLNSQELLDILNGASAIVAPSTGVLHLAASLGRPVVGLYSPKLEHSSTRWGPRGDQVIALTPRVDAKDARGPEAMRALSVESVIKSLELFGIGHA